MPTMTAMTYRALPRAPEAFYGPRAARERLPRVSPSSVSHYLHASERFGGLQWVGWALASASGCKPPAKAGQVQILPGPPSPTCRLVPGTRARARLGRVHRGWGLVFRERSGKLAISVAAGLAVVT